jgi:hypothetical protein
MWHLGTSSLPTWVGPVLAIIAEILARIQRRYYLEHIQILSYLFSLGFVVTVLGAVLAFKIEAFDADGAPLNEVGQAMRFAAYAALDIEGELWLLGGLLFLIFVPQIMSYIISGFFGRASQVRFLQFATPFVFWSVLKTIITGSGVAIGLVLAQSIIGARAIVPPEYLQNIAQKIVGQSVAGTTLWFCISFFYLGQAILLATIYSYFETEGTTAPLLLPIRILNDWATRHQ